MIIAKLDQEPLVVQDAGAGGAGFVMSLPAPRDLRLKPAPGWEVVARQNSKYLIAHAPDVEIEKAHWKLAVQACELALDTFAFKEAFDATLVKPTEKRITWWQDKAGPSLLIRGTMWLEARIHMGQPVVTDRWGRPVNARVGKDRGDWHPSLRFFRLSQATDDLYDSYRNLWLATENLLDAEMPRRPKYHSSERVWLKAALAYADWLVNLRRILQVPPNQNSVDWTYDYLYDEVRGSLFHAKASRNPLLPHAHGRLGDLGTRHAALSELYLRLLSVRLGWRRPTGAMTPFLFLQMTGPARALGVVRASDDRAGFDPAHGRLNSAGGRAFPLATSLALSEHFPYGYAVQGRTRSRRMSGWTIRKVGWTVGSGLVTAVALEGDLSPSAELRKLGADIVCRLRNVAKPREFDDPTQ